MEDIVKNLLTNLFTDEAGGGLVEYSLILALVAVVCATVLTSLSTKITTTITSVITAL